MAQAAKEAGVAHVIWSTLEDTRKLVPLSDNRMPTLRGKYKVPHFDAKGEADRFFTELGVPTTFLLDVVLLGQPHPLRHGAEEGAGRQAGHHLPDGRREAPGHRCRGHRQVRLRHLQEGRRTSIGKTVGIAGEHLTGAQMAAALSKALGQPVRYNEVTPEVYRGFGFPGADDLGNMFQFYRDFEKEVLRRAQRGRVPLAQSRAADVRAVARRRTRDRIPLE